MSARPRRSLHRTQGIDVPLRALGLVDADECWLAAHGQAHILRLQFCVDAVRNLFDLRPLLIGERLGRPRRIVQAANGHGVAELHVGRLDRASDGRGLGSIRRADQRDVALAGKQARGRIHPNPARARQERLCPGMQIRGVGLRAARIFRRALVRRQLNQIPGDKPRRDPQMSQNLHQQPCRIAARPRCASQASPRRSGRPAPAASHSQFRLAPFDSSRPRRLIVPLFSPRKLSRNAWSSGPGGSTER